MVKGSDELTEDVGPRALTPTHDTAKGRRGHAGD
jgi:hypothetical protein